MGMSNAWIIMLVVAVAGVLGGGLYLGMMNTATETATIAGDTVVEQKNCGGGTSVGITLRGVDKELAGTTATGLNAYIYDPSIGNVSGSASNTLTPLTTYKVMQAWTGSTAYYPQLSEFKTSCSAETKTIALPHTGTPTISFTNVDGGVNSASVTQAVGTDDDVQIKMLVNTPVNQYFGAQDCNVIVASYDKTDIDWIKIYKDGALLAPGTKPGSFAYFNTSYDGDDAFVLPQLKDGEDVILTIEIDSTTAGTTGATGSPRFNIYDCSGDIDQDTGLPLFSIQDEDKNILSLSPVNATMWVS